MKNLFYALLFVFPFAHAADFSLKKDECIILVASTKSDTEARVIAKKYPGSELYTSKSGYIAVGLEKISKQGSGARIKELLSAGKIPKGSNCADDSRITGFYTDDANKSALNSKSENSNENRKRDLTKEANDSIDQLVKKLSKRVGPEGALSCTLLSIKAMGVFSGHPKGSNEETMFYGFSKMFEVYMGIMKLLDVKESDPFFEYRANWAKSISVTDMGRYIEANCGHPEVFKLAEMGFK
jgi:hypothetical protein